MGACGIHWWQKTLRAPAEFPKPPSAFEGVLAGELLRHAGYTTDVEWPDMLSARFPTTRSRATPNADIGSIERNASEGSWL